MQKRNLLNSPRLLELKKRRRRVLLNKFLICISFSLVIVVALVFLSRIPSINIKEINVTGSKVIDSELVKSSIREALTGNYFFFFPKTNIFFYSKSDIENKLHEEFKRIKDIQISVKEKQTMEVTISERVALYTWCGEVPPKSEEEITECYFLDDSGYIFSEAPYFSGEVYFKFYGKVDLKDESLLGSTFSPEDFNKLSTFKESLEDIGLHPASLYKKDKEEVRVFLPKGKLSFIGPEIIFKIDSDLEILMENLDTALRTEPLLSNFKNKYSSLEYIDLRLGNKVYYKFN